jgi:hypothetical protein
MSRVELRLVEVNRVPRPRMNESGQLTAGYEGTIVVEAASTWVSEDHDGSYGIWARHGTYYAVDVWSGAVKIDTHYSQWRREDPNLSLSSARLWAHCIGYFASGGQCLQEDSRWLNPPSTPAMGYGSYGPSYWHTAPWHGQWILVPAAWGQNCAYSDSQVYWTNPNNSWQLLVGVCFTSVF